MSLKTCVLLLSICCSVSAVAEEQDLSLPAFPQAKVVASSGPEASYYRLGLGAQKKIKNIWRADKLEAVSGDLQRLTLEIPAGFTIDDAMAFYAQSLSLQELEEVYSCDGRDCGSSNSWANNHFLVRQLYGLDQSQRYRVYRNSISGDYTVLYLVQRGNKRIYLQLERLLVSGS